LTGPKYTGLDRVHVTLLTLNERLTPVDHQTHRCYDFEVPSDCEELRVRVSYTPKYVSLEESQALSVAALRRQRGDLAQRLGDALAASWTADLAAAANFSLALSVCAVEAQKIVPSFRRPRANSL